MERLTFKLGNSYGLEDKASSKVGLFTDYDGFYAYLVSTNRLGAYEDTGLTPEEIEQNKEYIQILEKENKLIKEQYIKEADTVDCYKKLATENAKLKELIKELGWKYENR